MDRWMEMEVFARIAEEGNMSKAADALDLSVSGVSRHLMTSSNGSVLDQFIARHASST